MDYFDELRRNWRPLLAASIGAGSGVMLFAYATTIFAPYLVREFHWTRAQMTLLGLTMFSSLIALIFIGRMTDRLGVRMMAIISLFLIPPCFIALSLMQGDFIVFLVIFGLLSALGSLTSPLVYTRLIAENFERSRGLALTIVTVTPALFGAVAAPLLTHVNDLYGWRTGYRAFMVWVVIGTLIAIALMPRNAGRPKAAPVMLDRPAPAKGIAYRDVMRQPVFWIIFSGFLLCTLPTTLHASQMAMMLTDRGLNAATVAELISLYAIGTVAGRISCGLALDFFPAGRVAAVSMMLPAIGYLLIATMPGNAGPIGFGMFLVGASQGAENDISSYLVARHFPVNAFSTTLSLVLSGVYFASGAGALILGLILKQTNSFTPFLLLVAGTVLVGSLLFLLLPRGRAAEPAAIAPVDEVYA